MLATFEQNNDLDTVKVTNIEDGIVISEFNIERSDLSKDMTLKASGLGRWNSEVTRIEDGVELCKINLKS